MQGPRPYLSVFPSTWYADDAVPKTKPAGKLSLVRLPWSPGMECAPSARERERSLWRSNGARVAMMELRAVAGEGLGGVGG